MTLTLKKPTTRNGVTYCGLSPHTGLPYYLTSHDEDFRCTWKDACMAARQASALGFRDWRVPTMDEMDILYALRDQIGGFEDDWYWTSAPYFLTYGWKIHMGTGARKLWSRSSRLRIRFVCGPDHCVQE